MPQIRKPDLIKKQTGAWRSNPQKETNPGVEAIGDPPKYFTPKERAIWREIIADTPSGILFRSDRLVLELASLLMTKLRAREPLTPTELGKLLTCISLLGGSPADRTRVSPAPEPAKDEFGLFSVVK